MIVKAELSTGYLLLSVQIQCLSWVDFIFYSFSIMFTSEANLKACFLIVTLIHFQQRVCVCVYTHMCVWCVCAHL